MPENMDHNEFDFYDDLITPFTEFLKRLNEFKEHPSARLQEREEEEKHGERKPKESDFQIKEEDLISLDFEPWLYNPPQRIFDLEKAMDEESERRAKKAP
jgi:U3 small nucleolar RNA-associated protein 14